MIKDLIDEFHEARLAGDHDRAMAVVHQIRTRYSFSKTDVLSALVDEDFKEIDCISYIEEHGGLLNN